nr:hypothetical protein [Klebsiella oxytoca]
MRDVLINERLTGKSIKLVPISLHHAYSLLFITIKMRDFID